MVNQKDKEWKEKVSNIEKEHEDKIVVLN